MRPEPLEFDLHDLSSECTLTNEVSCDTGPTLVRTVDNTGGGTSALLLIAGAPAIAVVWQRRTGSDA